MTREFLDEDLRKWEAYPSGGDYGLPRDAHLIFHCLSDEHERPRSVETAAEEDDLAAAVERWPDERLRQMLRESQALD